MTRSQPFLKTPFAITNAILSRIIRTIGKPKRKQVAGYVFSQLDAVQAMANGSLAYLRIRIAKGTQFVFLVLKKIRVD